MGGVSGLGQQVMAGRHGPEAAATASSFDALGMSVTPENVLGVYAVIQREVERLEKAVERFKSDYSEGMPELGTDLVSPHASRAFSTATKQLLRRCQADIGDLRRLSDELVHASREYGRTEAEIEASLAEVRPPSELPRLLADTGLPGVSPVLSVGDLYRMGLR